MTKAEINKRIFELPEDAEVVDCHSNSVPHGVFRSNKIILNNLNLIFSIKFNLIFNELILPYIFILSIVL